MGRQVPRYPVQFRARDRGRHTGAADGGQGGTPCGGHAAGFLLPGGLLVAVMSAGTAFRDDRATAEFCEMITASGGEITPLPDDAFKVSGTDVRTVLVTLPAAAERSAAA